MNAAWRLEADQLQQLFDVFRKNGYATVGPTLRDDSIVYDRINSTRDLPIGWKDEQHPGAYRVVKRNDNAYFGFNAPPQSWKRFLYPPERQILSARRNGKGIEVLEKNDQITKYAFVGVRPCELEAMRIQDGVFASGEYKDESYVAARRNAITVVLNCTSSGGNCFCSSMKTGPGARGGFDLGLTEVLENGSHYFVAEVGSESGSSIMSQMQTRRATQEEIDTAVRLVKQAEQEISKSMDVQGLPQLLSQNLEHHEWDEIGKRCLTCGNCTLVCPTCFCSTIEDSTDLAGATAVRTRRWDSCFTVDFAKVAGGNFRATPKSRYRQWLTHKLWSWVEQFGTFGCVGCGRCITWCPVGIDITEEVRKIRGN